MWAASARERKAQSSDAERRKRRHRLDSGISEDPNNESVINIDCQECETALSSQFNCENRIFKLVPVQRTMYVLKECDSDDPNQIEVKSFPGTNLDRNMRKRKTSGYINEWYQMDQKGGQVGPNVTESTLFDQCNSDMSQKQQRQRKIAIPTTDKSVVQGRHNSCDLLEDARQRPDQNVQKKRSPVDRHDDTSESWERQLLRESDKGCKIFEVKPGVAKRQDSSAPLLNACPPELATKHETTQNTVDSKSHIKSMWKNKKVIGGLVIGALIGSVAAGSVFSLQKTEKSASDETEAPILKKELVKSFGFEQFHFRNDPRALVFLGGERAGYMTDIVEVSPFDSSSLSCALPPLPEKLKWGSAGFVSESLVVCGGENERTNPSCLCWVLGGKQDRWHVIGNLTRYIDDQSCLLINNILSVADLS